MTKRFVKFSSLFAVVAMLLGLMVTACSEGNNTPAVMDDSAAALAVKVNKVPTNAKTISFPEGVDFMRLTFVNDAGDELKKLFKSETSSYVGDDAEVWVENDSAILMTPTFTEKEVAAKYNTLIINAFKGKEWVACTETGVTIDTGINSVEIASDKWSDEPIVEGNWLITTVGFEGETNGYDCPINTSYIRVVAADKNGKEVVAQDFAAKAEDGVKAWTDNGDGTVTMAIELTEEQLAKNPTVVAAGCADAETNILGGYFAPKIDFSTEVVNVDFSSEAYKFIDAKDVDARVDVVGYSEGHNWEVYWNDTKPVTVLLKIKAGDVALSVNVSDIVELIVDETAKDNVKVVEDADVASLKGLKPSKDNKVTAKLNEQLYEDFAVNVVEFGFTVSFNTEKLAADMVPDIVGGVDQCSLIGTVTHLGEQPVNVDETWDKDSCDKGLNAYTFPGMGVGDTIKLTCIWVKSDSETYMAGMEETLIMSSEADTHCWIIDNWTKLE